MHHILSYPRLLSLAASVCAAYVLYHVGMFVWLHGRLDGLGYPAAFGAGLLFSYGFTTPFAVAALVGMAPDVNPFLAAPLAGLGALLSDLVIFELLRVSFFGTELERLRQTSIAERVYRLFHHESVPERLRKYAVWLMAIIVIGSPLPDEIGVAHLSSTTTLSNRTFSIICVTMNTLGIFILLLIARAMQG